MPLIQKLFIVSSMLLSLSGRTPTSCTTTKAPPLKCLNITVDNPLVGQDGMLITNVDQFNIFYMENITIYQFQYRFDSSSNGELIVAGYRDYYFVYQKGNEYGYAYGDPRVNTNERKLRIDSLLNKQAYQNFQWHLVALRKPSAVKTDSSGNLKELYVGPTKHDRNQNDSVTFYYTDRLKEFDFSLSKSLDSLKGKKLYRIEIYYPEAHSKELNVTFPKRVTRFEMKEIPVENPGLIREYIEKFKREHPTG